MSVCLVTIVLIFLSTLSLRRATHNLWRALCPPLFLSTLSLRRATRVKPTEPDRAGISIHALLAESDVLCGGLWKGEFNFYPRSPCGERRAGQSWKTVCSKFLSTLSLRRATDEHITPEQAHKFLSTLSLRRATYTIAPCFHLVYISIHALLAESDGFLWHFCPCDIIFLSTLSLRRATESMEHEFERNAHFYPRSPCGERLLENVETIKSDIHFYPRSPCGERQLLRGT